MSGECDKCGEHTMDCNKHSEYDDPYHRYMNDVWYFGILHVTGKTLVIESIDENFEDYIKVSMHEGETINDICKIWGLDRSKYIGTTCSRRKALVRKENIVMIFELADT